MTKLKSMLYQSVLLISFIVQIQAVIKVDTDTQLFVDDFGRSRIFHGVNAVYKIPPWAPMTDSFDPQLSLTDEDIQNLKEWGFTAVRLGVMWPGVAPSANYINQTYLDVMQSIIDKLGAQGIYSIVDAHQDVFSRMFCGEGVPDWLVETSELTLPFPMPVTLSSYELDPTNNYPNLTACLSHVFAEYYFSDKVSNAFQHLYDNVNNLQDHFIDFWKIVSSQFSKSEYVLGYELINEPWTGDIFTHPDLLLPYIADKENLAPMYYKLHNAIRNNDNEHVIFFEKALIDFTGSCGFDEGPGGVAYNDRQAYSYHIYCAPTDSNGDPRNLIECDAVDDLVFEASISDVKRLGCGSFLTEFGAMSNSTIADTNLGFLADLADMHLQSWTYWQFKLFEDLTTSGPSESFYNGQGQLEESKVKALSRTHAQATAGTLLKMRFNTENGEFRFAFNIDTTIKAPTVVYLNQQVYYPNGFVVTVTPAGSVSWSQPENNFIDFVPTTQTVNGQQIQISIVAK